MQYLQVENISKSFGDKILFSNISLTISKGEKIALIAKNGSGKTTLLKVLAGEESVEGENAKVIIAKDIRIAYLLQDPQFNEEESILAAVYQSDQPAVKAFRLYEEAMLNGDQSGIQKQLGILEELEAWDIESRVREVLGRLSITRLDQKMGELSGGQVKRVALAKILIDDPDFLILDEPTNHLDLEMIEWLEQYLAQNKITLFMVTHDRYFLERVCNTIIELDRGQLYTYRGNYSQYLEKREMRMTSEGSNLIKMQRLFTKELDWMRRQPKARTTKAKSRIDQFEIIKEKASEKIVADAPEFIIQSARLGSKILEMHNVSKSFDDTQILSEFSYKFKKNERLGIIGPNGAGKSSFLHLITGILAPDIGRIVVGETIVFGHYTQEGLTDASHKKVVDVIRDIAEYIPLEKGLKLTAESLLEKFLFPRSQQQVYVSQLSGGEKRRLHLLTILMKNPNFLILDEPTNDLDIITLNVLEEYLESYKGVLVIVTHDRYFMDKLVDHLFIMEGNGFIRDFNGTYTDYISEKMNIIPETTTVKQPQVKSPHPVKLKSFDTERKELKKLEKVIESLEKRKEEINQFFLNPNLEASSIEELSKELGYILRTLEETEEKWMELAEIIG